MRRKGASIYTQAVILVFIAFVVGFILFTVSSGKTINIKVVELNKTTQQPSYLQVKDIENHLDDYREEYTDGVQNIKDGVTIRGETMSGGLQEIRVYNDTGSIYNIPQEVGYTLTGDTYTTHHITTVPASGSVTYLLNTSEKNMHVTVQKITSTTGPGRLYLFENTSTTDPGDNLPEINVNRASTKNSTINATHNPTVTSYGTLLEISLLASDKKTGGIVPPDSKEWVLEKDNTYSLRYNNTATSEATVNFEIRWYEPR